jgi:glycine cleavage system H protein
MSTMRREFIPYMGYQWLKIEDDSVIIGVSEEGLEEISEISGVNLPAENEAVSADEICGEVETEEGPLNLYSPVDGKVVEINSAVLDSPELISEDPLGDGWLLRIEPTNASDLEDLDKASSGED